MEIHIHGLSNIIKMFTLSKFIDSMQSQSKSQQAFRGEADYIQSFYETANEKRIAKMLKEKTLFDYCLTIKTVWY